MQNYNQHPKGDDGSHTINNYDKLLNYVQENIDDINKGNILKTIDKLDDDIFKRIYSNDSWIIKEKEIVTGNISSISKEKVKGLIKEDVLDNGIVGMDIKKNNDDNNGERKDKSHKNVA